MNRQVGRCVTERLRADAAGIARAAEVLRGGGLVAFPTETVYGLGADATNDDAVGAIYAAKGRPSVNPLIVHVADLEAARKLGDFPDTAVELAEAFWPGALTLVVPLRADAGLSPKVTAGNDSVALRMPASDTALAILRACRRPVAAPSANPSGRISPTTAQHVLDGLDGRIDAVLDGGPTEVGLESTILGVARDGTVTLLREGGIPAHALGVWIDAEALTDDAHPTAPGQMSSHYAPRAALRLNATKAEPGEVLLGFGPVAGDLSLSPTGDLREAARNLYAMLHDLDGRADRIAVAAVPDTGLGRAINDRLRRAAAPRN